MSKIKKNINRSIILDMAEAILSDLSSLIINEIVIINEKCDYK